MKSIRQIFFIAVLGLSSQLIHADVLVLVHGFLGNAASWENVGINAVLDANGWYRAGSYNLDGQSFTVAGGTNKVYNVELPSIAPLSFQADNLQWTLNNIATIHPNESVSIAAHSAGGIVARLALVRGVNAQIEALVTIATPHMGTSRALEALDASDNSGMFGWVKDMFGGGLYQTIKHSRGALIDLIPAHPGSLLYWLNGQSHPDIKYFSIIRTDPSGNGDELVSAFSQDMNNVPALRGRSTVIPIVSRHSLHQLDGITLLNILSQISGL